MGGRHRPVVAAVSLAVAAFGGLALVGCTSGQPVADPATAVPTLVGDPLDVSKVVNQPCVLLRPDQLAQFHLGATGAQVTMPSPNTLAATGGPVGCAWTPTPGALPSYRAGIDQRSGGLAALYQHRGTLPVFNPTTVTEYPAVHTATNPADLRHGRCTVEIAIANDTLLIVQGTINDPNSLDYPDPCPDTDQFAAAIIANSEGQAP